MASCWPIFFFFAFFNLVDRVESEIHENAKEKKKTTNFKITLIIVMITERESHIHPS